MLPNITTLQEYKTIYANDATWLPAIHTICARHQVDMVHLHREVLGTHVVFGTEQIIVKLFCPLWPDDFLAERAVLATVHGLPTPELIASGELAGWPYLLMSKLPGVPAEAVWDSLTVAEKRPLIARLGQIMQQLHAQPAVPEVAIDWPAFMAERLANWEAHHQAEEPWYSWLKARMEIFHEAPFEPVLLSADITADHVLLAERNGRWHITGFIDLGDAMMGHPYYDFIAPLAFYTLGCPELSRLLVESYGSVFTTELADQLTTYCFLHKFGKLSDFLARYPAANPEEFCQALWGIHFSSS
jgi:hygromycin-B 7''-O-kinase